MNWRTIRAITLKDLTEVRRNRMAWMPMVIVPLIFVVVVPLLVIVAPTLFNLPMTSFTADPDIQLFLDKMPSALADQIKGLNDHQTVIVVVLAFMLAPMFLLLPIMVSSVIGAESFVGEKERKTMEALLYTPATDQELFLGKMLASFVPAVLVSWLSFLVYTLILNSAGASVMGRIWFPTPTWWPLMIWVTPAVSLLGMIGAVIVSARVSTFMEAYQSTGILVLPVIALVIGQVAGVVYLNVETTILVGIIVWLVDAGLITLALRIFSRQALMARV